MASVQTLMARLQKLEALKQADGASLRIMVRFVDAADGKPLPQAELQALRSDLRGVTVTREAGEAEQTFIDRAFALVGDGLLVEAFPGEAMA